LQKKNSFRLLSVALIYSAHLAVAQTDYNTLKAQVGEYQKTGDYARAIPIAEKAVTQVEAEYGKTNYRYAAALTKLGEVYQGGGMLDRAEKTFIDVVALDKEKYGETEYVYAQSISRLAAVYYTEGKFELALPYFTKSVGIARKNFGSEVLYANALNSAASTNFELSNYREAEAQFTEALAIYQTKETEPSLQHANAKNGLGVLYNITGRYDDAEVLLLSASAWRKPLSGDTSDDYAQSLKNLAGLYKNMGRYSESEVLHQQSIRIIKSKGENTLSYANSLYNYALLYHATGNYRQAENMLKESLAINKKILGDQSSSYATGLNGLANLYAEIGLFTESETLYKQVIEIYRSQLGESHPYYATALANLGALFYQMGRYEQGERYYNSALVVERKHFGEDHIEVATTLYYMGILYRDMLKLDMSEQYFKKAIAIQQEHLGIAHPDYIKSVIGLGDTYVKSGKLKEGIVLYNQSMPYFKTPDGQGSANYAIFINNLAALYKITDDYTNAERLYQEALAIQLQRWGEASSEYKRTLANLSELYITMHQYVKAEPMIKKVIDAHLKEIQHNFPAMSEREKSQFYKTISFQFDAFNSFALLRKNQNPLLLGDMYNHQLATKGMLINGSVKIKNQILKSEDAALIALYKIWIQKKEQIARVNKLTVAERVKRKISIDVLENEANELERSLSLKSERFKNSDTPLYTWQNVRSKLKKGEAAVEIIRFKKYNSKLTVFTDTIYFAALIITPETQKNPTLVLLENGNELETKYIKYYRNVIQQQKNGLTMEDKFSYPQFWQKMGEKLTGVNKVYLSLDGVYNQINLNTLVNPRSGKYLIDEIDIEIVTNTSDLLKVKSTKKQKKSTASLIGFPNYNLGPEQRRTEAKKRGILPEPQSELSTVALRGIESMNTIAELPGTKIEVQEIDKILTDHQWQVTSLLDNQALEETVKSLEGPTLFHIATHGFFDPDIDRDHDQTLNYENVLFRSGLLLAGSAATLYSKRNSLEVGDETTEDGVLTAYEAMNMDLDNTELVVLSACETGLGEVTNGEGVYGLQRAFKVAGADAIIFSLWKVNDEATQKLMTSFYNNWLISGNKREAFTKAQLAIRQEFELPYFWGAFVLIGE
jgi:CHAT domain-containing protein